MEVNEKIKKYLTEHGIKQSFLVEKGVMSRYALNAVVNGKRKITADELAKVANALQVDANIFLQ